MKIRLAIADNNSIQRDGLQAILERENFKVSCTMSCPEMLVEPLTQTDLLLWVSDLDIPLSKNLINQLKFSSPQLHVVILDQNLSLKAAIKAIHSGASGYITRNVQKDELLFAIHYILKGKKYINPDLTMEIFNKLSDIEEHISSLNTDLTFSDKEKEVLDLMISGYANREIAYRLFTTKRNVEDLRQNLINKTGAKDNLSLILYRIHQEYIQKE